MNATSTGHSPMLLTRCLASLVLANLASLVVLNLFCLPTLQTVPVYALSLVIAFVSLRSIRWRRVPPMADRLPWLLAVVALALLTLPRVPYLLEWIPSTYVKTAFDDYARVAELVSMTLSPQYPLHHPENTDLLFSFYYAPLYPMAVLKLALPVLTLKDTIFVGNLLYHVLLLGSLVEVSRLLLRGRQAVRILLALVCLFGGFDWLIRGQYLSLRHPEWWQSSSLFNGNTQVSSFYSGMFWVVHHFVGFYALVIAYAVLFYSRSVGRWVKPAVALLLLCAAFYSSVFAFMSVPLFLLVNQRVLWRKLLRSPVFPIVCCVGCVPLFLYLGKFPDVMLTVSTFRIRFTDWFLLDKLLSLPVYTVLVPLVEFGGIPFLILLVFRRLSRPRRRYFAAAAVFFLATYVIAHHPCNNLSMRGMFLPTFTFFILFAHHYRDVAEWFRTHLWKGQWVPKAAMVLLLAGGGFGTLYNATALVLWSNATCTLSYQGLGLPLPEWAILLQEVDSRALARDPTVTRLPARNLSSEQRRTLINAEKVLDRAEPEEMDDWESTLARKPRIGYFR